MKWALIATIFGSFAFAQNPVSWTLSSDVATAAPGSRVALKLTPTIDEGWHIYSLGSPQGVPTSIQIAENPAVHSFQLFQPKPARKFDKNLGGDIEIFEKDLVFLVPVELSKNAEAGSVEIVAQVRYAACNDHLCLNPKKKTASFTLTVDAAAPAVGAFVAPAGYTEFKESPAPSSPAPASTSDANAAAGQAGLGAFLLTAFGLGLASIFTPCVFPMIPITVSFFINQKGGIVQALVFSLGIIFLFCALGLGVTAAIGPFGVNQLAANLWVNGFITLVFGAFALSLLGAFEITLPSGLLTKLDSASRRGGYFGTLLMGLTFALTSFACIGPFMGSLLVASVQSKGAQPVLGMASFATGLAAPFFFLAAFPSYLKKLPRSGGWLARVKVVMGFILLAAMLKYASVIDQVMQWNVLTRERFLAAWFVLFAMAGLYLLGLLKLEGSEEGETLGIGRLLVASAFLIFSFSLLPAMFGAPLGQLDAYVPAAAGPGLGGVPSAEAGQPWMKNQYKQALEIAKQQNKFVLVDFTGYACTNCHWMKANMFPRPEIAEVVKDMVLVELYTDGRDKESEDNGKFQEETFQSNAVPFYVLIDADGKVIAHFAGIADDPSTFLKFLKSRPAGA
jgi:thiol:disulfide interchange protein DsbD